MVAVSNTPYIVSIDDPLDFENIEQRAQISHGTRVYDIMWDITNERVIAYYNDEEGTPVWNEIRFDGTATDNIRLTDVLLAFGYNSQDTVPILTWPLESEWLIENYLVTTISTNFLMQMSIQSLDIPYDDDPTQTSSDNESIGTDYSIEVDEDDPSGQTA
jgi:hypothetical protein